MTCLQVLDQIIETFLHLVHLVFAYIIDWKRVDLLIDVSHVVLEFLHVFFDFFRVVVIEGTSACSRADVGNT